MVFFSWDEYEQEFTTKIITKFSKKIWSGVRYVFSQMCTESVTAL